MFFICVNWLLVCQERGGCGPRRIRAARWSDCRRMHCGCPTPRWADQWCVHGHHRRVDCRRHRPSGRLIGRSGPAAPLSFKYPGSPLDARPEEILQNTILLLGVALFVAAAYGDIKTLTIPNALVAAVAALGAVRLIAIGDLNFALYTIGTSIVVLVATFLLFWRGFLGGGDAKLIPATVLLVVTMICSCSYY